MTTDEPCIIETPWGVDVEALARRDDQGGTVMTYGHPALAIVWGIHSPEQRASFVLDAEDAERNSPAPDALHALAIRYAGRQAQRIKLPPPSPPLYPILCKQLTKQASRALDSWCHRVADRAGWRGRSADLLVLLDVMLAAGARPGPSRCEEPAALGSHIVRTLTAVLEHLGDTEVTRIEQAAFYAITDHPKWRAVGREWAGDCRTTWWRDWIAARPAYRRAAELAGLHHGVPDWLWRL